MAGEIATAYIALAPSMKDFGSSAARQIGPQATMVGAQAGRQAGAAFSGAASKESENWLATTAKNAIKNVTLYGSMYAIITNVQRGIRAMFDTMIGFNAELEQSAIGFETLLGSSAAAEDQMAWIKDFAKETPFQFGDLIGYSQQLLALGFNAEEARNVLQATGDAAAALGRGSDSIQRINLALGQMWTKGKVQSQEMVQLTEVGIGGWQILAEAYGASVEAVQEAVTAGLVKASDAVPALLDGMNARFGGLMEKQSQTYAGMVANIQDTLQQQLAKAGEPLFDELTSLAREFLDTLDDPEVVKMMEDLGNALASGAKFLAEGAKFAWEYRDAILAVAIAYSGAKLGSSMLSGPAASAAGRVTAETAVQAAIAKTTAAELALTAAQQNLTATTLTVAEAQAVVETSLLKTASAESAMIGLQAKKTYTSAEYAAANAKITASIAATTAAELQLKLVRADPTAAAAMRVQAESQVQASLALTTRAELELAAAQKAQVAASRGAGMRSKLSGMGPMAGQMVGIGLVIDGYKRVGEAAADGESATAGFAENIAGGALAGAAFGSVFPGVGTAIGAASGALIGLTASVWAYQQAVGAANTDTSLAKDALESYGVEANLASLALAGVTNENITAAGGIHALTDAMQSGKFQEFIDNLSEAANAAYLANEDLIASGTATEDALAKSQALSDGLGDAWFALAPRGKELAAVQEQITATSYEAAFAADMQTGALGTMTEAAWNAVIAQGGLGNEALNAAIRMEGLAGTAGYVTQMIAGIPKGTSINFSTNAAEIAGRILALQASLEAVQSAQGDNGSGATNSLQARINSLKSQLSSALTTPTATLSLPTKTSAGRGGSRASRAQAAADDARRAAEEAARKLAADRNAQLQFGDAFGQLMQSALEGNFDEYRDDLEKQIVSLTRDGYKAAADTLRSMSTALTTASLDYAALTNKLKAASSAYDELTGKMKDQYNTSRDLISGLGKATDAQSFDQLAYLLGETTTRALDYQTVLEQLKAQGLSKDLWDQLAQAGPESMGLAQSILDQGTAGIDQLNTLSDGLMGAADAMGTLVSNAMYEQGVDAMQAYIDGLKSQSGALEAQMETIANNVLNKTAGAITPGNAGYAPISAGSQQVINEYNLSVSASSFGDLQSIQDFIAMLEQAATTELVNQAGTVTS